MTTEGSFAASNTFEHIPANDRSYVPVEVKNSTIVHDAAERMKDSEARMVSAKSRLFGAIVFLNCNSDNNPNYVTHTYGRLTLSTTLISRADSPISPFFLVYSVHCFAFSL